MAAALTAAPAAEPEAPPTWHALDRAYERKGKDWAIVYACPTGLPCLACGRPTRLMVCFSPRAALPICGTCRGY
jgi:hypothetical protein